MDQNIDKIRYILQYYVDKGDNASQACGKICGVSGKGAVSKSAARKWFVRFRSRNFDVKDELRSGRPITEKSDEILEKIVRDQHFSSPDIAYELSIHHQTILNRLRKARFKKKLDVWVPHELNVKNKWKTIEPFLKRIISGDEKRVKYENIVWKRSWKKKDERSKTTSKTELTANKVLYDVCMVGLEGDSWFWTAIDQSNY